MYYILNYFIKRLPRDGFKALAAPALLVFLVLLVNMMGGFRAWQEEEYEYVISSLPINAVITNRLGVYEEGLFINERFLSLFTDPEAQFSLHGYVDELTLCRSLAISRIQETPVNLQLTGITSALAMKPDAGVNIEFFFRL